MKRQAAFTLIELPFDHLDKLGAGGLRAVRKRKSEAFTLIELLIVIGILGVLVTILVPIVGGQIEQARRKSCAANLRAVGQKMIEYAHDNKRKRYPLYWSTNVTWDAIGDKNNVLNDADVKDPTRPLFMLMYEPYEDPPDSDIWIRKANEYVPPDVFVCPSDNNGEVDPLNTTTYPNQVGFASYKNVSYSFQHHYTATGLGITLSVLTPSDRVIMADKNPLTAYSESSGLMEATGKAHDSGSANHGGQGQNVLRADASVEWTDRVDLGPDHDTIWDPTNNIAGNLLLTGAPQDKLDVFLVP